MTKINNLGYSLLFSENRLGAIPVFRLITEKYPGSANSWDSMEDAYKINNQLDSAKLAYEKSCRIARQMNNVNAAGMCGNLAECVKMIREAGHKKQ